MASFKEFLNKRTKTAKELAKKHSVPLSKIFTAIRDGTEIEKEHTTRKDVARTIALAHIDEDPDYYTKLKKMERD